MSTPRTREPTRRQAFEQASAGRLTRAALLAVALGAVALGAVALGAAARLPAQARPALNDPCPASDTQPALNRCADTAARRADAALNAAYHHVLARTSSTRRPLLRAAQRSWIAYRDSHCRFIASQYDGGSMYPMQLLFCRAGVTETRTAELRRGLADEAH